MVAWLRAIVQCAAATLLAGAAAAEGFSGGVGLTSDKLYRGFSQNRGGGSLLLDLSYQRGGWAWSGGAATLHDNGRGTRSEVTLSAARTWQIESDWSTQLSATAYTYPGSTYLRYGNYAEFGAQLAWRDTLQLSVLAAPRARATGRNRQLLRGRTLAYEAALHLPMAGRWSFDAGLGWFDTRRIEGVAYTYGSVGLSWGVGPVTLFVSRVASTLDSRAGAPKAFAGDRTALSAWLSF